MLRKTLALVICVLIGVSMFAMFEIQPVKASLSESYLRNWVAGQLYVKMSRWENNQWVYFQTRDFNYTEHWYAKLLLYNYGIRYPTIMKLNTRLYPAEGITDYSTCYILFIGMEDSDQPLEGYDDLFLVIGACQSDSGKYYTFIDTMMGGGQYRKQVYRKACFGKPELLLFDYPNEKWLNAMADPYGNTFEDYDFPDKAKNGEGINMPQATSDYSYNRPEDGSWMQWQCRKLGAKVYGWNGTQFIFAYDRYRWQPKTDNPNKWYLKFYVRNKYYATPNIKVFKYVIGLEDIASEIYGSLDSFHDLIVVLVQIETRRPDGWIEHVYKIDLLYICGGLNKKVVYEQHTDYWINIFQGYDYGQHYAYNIPLETTVNGYWEE